MSGALILSRDQAQACLNAMAALKAVGGRIGARLPAGGGVGIAVHEGIGGTVCITSEYPGEAYISRREQYASRVEFMHAYGLDVFSANKDSHD